MPHRPLRRFTRHADQLPLATVRTRVTVPMAYSDGPATTAQVTSFSGLLDGQEHLAVAFAGRPEGQAHGDDHGVPLVRVHSECLTGDVLGSQRCDCGPQLIESVRRLSTEGGYLLYLRQEGRGIGLYAKLDAYRLQDAGLDTYTANRALGFEEDARDYGVAAQMLFALGVSRIALLSNNPDKAEQLGALGVDVVDRVPTGVHLTAANAGYLAAKVERAGHALDVVLADGIGGWPGD